MTFNFYAENKGVFAPFCFLYHFSYNLLIGG